MCIFVHFSLSQLSSFLIYFSSPFLSVTSFQTKNLKFLRTQAHSVQSFFLLFSYLTSYFSLLTSCSLNLASSVIKSRLFFINFRVSVFFSVTFIFYAMWFLTHQYNLEQKGSIHQLHSIHGALKSYFVIKGHFPLECFLWQWQQEPLNICLKQLLPMSSISSGKAQQGRKTQPKGPKAGWHHIKDSCSQSSQLV